MINANWMDEMQFQIHVLVATLLVTIFQLYYTHLHLHSHVNLAKNASLTLLIC
jgi:hypothetical protein